MTREEVFYILERNLREINLIQGFAEDLRRDIEKNYITDNEIENVLYELLDMTSALCRSFEDTKKEFRQACKHQKGV